jgi:predicted acylesterase/phospholipase RssA
VHPRDLPPCDLVMKGGATSGIVYPGAVLELSAHYRFSRVGGTSAGALAATVAAAAEYGRQRAGRGELQGLDEVVEDLKRPGFMLSLLQAPSGLGPLLKLGTGLMLARNSHWRQTRVLAVAAIRHRPVHAVLATVGAVGIAVLLATAFRHLGIVPAVALAALGSIGLILLASWAILAPLVSMLRDVWHVLPEQGFGVCPGIRQDPNGPDGITDWIHAKIQRCAQLPLDRPLTFAMLEEEGIGLQMVATDLGLARPVTIPFSSEQYLFAPGELRRMFPDSVVDSVLLAAGAPDAERDSSRAWFLPAKELPVVIAARLSASVPLLLSSMRLYSARPDMPRPIESFIADGAITSNFPIHFFDDWLPSHPTFGLDLVPVSEDEGDEVFMPSGAGVPRLPRTPEINSLGAFLRQIDDAGRNWRDELQAELPGNRDRVCQIRMRAGEGGFNFDADPETIVRLHDRGRAAGRTILRTFDWDQHRFVRYATLMELLQENLALLGERFESYRELLRSGRAPGAGSGAEWARAAERATSELIEHSPAAPSFDSGEKPQPEPAMRIAPRV